MSNAATTVPGKRNDFMNNKPRRTYAVKTDTLTQGARNPQQVKNRIISKVAEKHKASKADILVVDKENDSSVRMKKTSDLIQASLQKLGRQSPVVNYMESSHKVTNNCADQNPEDIDENIVGNQSLTNPSNKQTIKILSMQDFDTMMDERLQLMQLNTALQNRVSDLETETTRILGEFTSLYQENEQLREKLQPGNETFIEPYSRILEDRQILRDAEENYKKKIVKLEHQIKELQQINDSHAHEISTLKGMFQKRNIQKELATKVGKLQSENKSLKTENQFLQEELNSKHSNRAEREKPKIRETQKEINAVAVVRQRKQISHEILNSMSLRTTTDVTPKRNIMNKSTTKTISSVSENKRQRYISTQPDNKHANSAESREKFYYEYILPDSFNDG